MRLWCSLKPSLKHTHLDFLFSCYFKTSEAVKRSELNVQYWCDIWSFRIGIKRKSIGEVTSMLSVDFLVNSATLNNQSQRCQTWSKHFFCYAWACFRDGRWSPGGDPSLTLIGASAKCRTVWGWLMCSAGWAGPVRSVHAFINQQLLTHIVVHKKGNPCRTHRISVCQTVSTGLAFGCQALIPPSQSLFLTVWAETWTGGSRKRSWYWGVVPTQPLHLSWCTSLSTDNLSHALDTVLGNTGECPVEGTYGHGHPGGKLQCWLQWPPLFFTCVPIPFAQQRVKLTHCQKKKCFFFTPKGS